MTKAQGDEYELKKLGRIKPHSIDKVKDDQKRRLSEAENKALTILELLTRKMPLNYDLTRKKDQNKAIKLVREAKIFNNDLELIPFMRAFIFTRWIKCLVVDSAQDTKLRPVMARPGSFMLTELSAVILALSG